MMLWSINVKLPPLRLSEKVWEWLDGPVTFAPQPAVRHKASQTPILSQR
jgi:hypothetical protein